ncbi:MAG: hypothetical protein Q7R76_04995 [Candidatus Woesearchaeota archaeon]|nr:hypothetical protein [Candidatus Woesearchaeota archaeon]
MSIDSEIQNAIQWFGKNVSDPSLDQKSHYAKAVCTRYTGWQRLEAEISLIKGGFDPNVVPFDVRELQLLLRPGPGMQRFNVQMQF